MSSIAKVIEEISILGEIENQLELYIELVRQEQSEFRNFIQEMMCKSWQQGEAKEAFLNRMTIFNDDYTKRIQNLENTLLEIIETKKWINRLYLIMIPN